ncbi:MAG: tRNA (adenosine(37)-N6)-threonylcarbamoyltransferase complex ATPase subunit type 1 TsaE [Geobacteraceae bacterium]|nr:tRNA (adenosine(37)-N6)-threonylcarbamoyltransferase complex ATPase subunit type 1 TsaE [Geobacteraceae bacterium]
MYTFPSRNTRETLQLGERLGRLLQPGDFVALVGDLGSGKTHFVQGIALGMGVPSDICVSSPSYTLLNEYAGRVPLYHFDLYRLHGDADILDLGFEEYFYGRGACVVEWADRLSSELPEEHLMITFINDGETLRSITFHPAGPRYRALLRELFPGLGKYI